MAGRDASYAVQAEVDADANSPIHLVEVYFDDGTIYLTDAYRSVSWNGNEYPAQGHFLDFEGLEETLVFQMNPIIVSLSGTDNARTWPAFILDQDVEGRRLVIRRAFILDGGQVISDPIVLFDGDMDVATVEDDPIGGETTVTIEASNEFANFSKEAGRRTNDTDQQQHFSGDRFFQFTAEQATTIYWGGRKLSSAYQARQRATWARNAGLDAGD